MFRKPSWPLAKQLSALTSTVQSGARQHRLLRWAWPAFTVALAVFLRLRHRAAQPAPITGSFAPPAARAAVNTAPFNISLPSSIRAVRPDEGPPQAAAMGDISPTTSDPNPAAPDAALPLPTLEAEPSTRAELRNIASEISAAPVVNLEPPFPADQPPPHDAALPTPPLGPESFGPGDLVLADAPVAATPVVGVPRSDVAAPADLPSGAASDSMPSGVPDDLTIIEGIGPKLAEVLRSAGITSFRQLAATTPEYLQQIITQAGIRIGDPTTWPEQAALAASGNLQALRELQNTLKGGRRV